MKNKIIIISLVTIFFLAGVGTILYKQSEIDALTRKLKVANDKVVSLEERKQEEENNEDLLYQCLQNAEKSYSDRWNSTCKDRGEKLNADGSCLLDSYTAQNLDNSLKTSQDLCVTLYK